jgi:anti-anti-sigma factor
VTVLKVEVGEVGGAPLVVLDGEIDLANVDDVMSTIESSVPNHALGLVLDLTALTYLDSTGLRLLFRLSRQLHERDQQLTLVVPVAAAIATVLRLGGVFDAMPVVPDVQTFTQQDNQAGLDGRAVVGEDP